MAATDQEAWEKEKKFIEEWLKKAAEHAPPGNTCRGWRREDAYDRKIFSRPPVKPAKTDS